MRLPAVTFRDGTPQPWSTRLRRANLIFGAMAIAVGLATGAWPFVVFGALGVVAALVIPSTASLKAMREAEERRALTEGD